MAIMRGLGDPYAQNLQRRREMENMLRNEKWEAHGMLEGWAQNSANVPRAKVTLKGLLNNGIYTAPTQTLLDLWVARFGEGWVNSAEVKEDARDLYNELQYRKVGFAERDAYDEDTARNVTCVRPQKFLV